MAKSTATRMRERIRELSEENLLLRKAVDIDTARALADLTAENESLRREVVELNTELDEAFKEPKWFTHKGDYLVVFTAAASTLSAVIYLGKTMGWW